MINNKVLKSLEGGWHLLMQAKSSPFVPWVARPNEYERLVTDLVDQRFFGPVAITTSLRGARGMGKTRLARAVCGDPRVVEAFPDGIFWVILGESLSPLELLSKMERLVYDLTGEQRGLTDLQAAEEHLHDLIHSRKVLLVLDEANSAELVRPFLHTGPGGGILIITYSNDDLPFGARLTPVDIMVTEEAVALLSAGLGDENRKPPTEATAASSPQQRRVLPPVSEQEVDPLLAGLVLNETQNWNSEPTVLADAEALARLKQAENRQWAASVGMAADVADAVAGLAERLNEWPLLLALVNGLLRGCLRPGDPLKCKSLLDATRMIGNLLERNGLEEFWLVTDPTARERAQNAVITACLEPLADDVRECLFELAVFPRFEEIPLQAVSVLWGEEDAETRATCELLTERALVSYDAESGMIYLHPVIHAFIIERLRAGVLVDLHTRIIEGYASRCREKPDLHNLGAWSTGPNDGYFFQHLAGHLAAAGRQAELQTLLFQFRWLSNYLRCVNLLSGRRGDLYSLLIDYELALSTALDRQSAELRLVQDALRLAAPILARDSGQLSTQLLGRLLAFDEPEIKALLEQAKAWSEEPWLRPLSVCFAQPGNDEIRVLTGHSDWVTSLAMLPDGQHAISSSLDGSLRVWDLASGQTTLNLQAHPDGISAMIVTPDGRQAVITSWDGWLRVWDLGSSEEVLQIKAHNESIGALAITPDGQRVITGADDRLIRVWDRITGVQLLELVGHGDLVRSLVVSPDGRTLISSSWDATVRIWDLETGKQMHFLTGHDGWVPAVAISPDGSYALSGGWDRTLRIWDLWTGEGAGMIAGFSAPLLAIAVLPDGQELLVGTGDGSLHLLKFQPGEVQESAPDLLVGESDRPGGADATGTKEIPVRDGMLEARSTPPPAQLPPHRDLAGHTSGINAIILTREGRFAITAGDDRTVRVWDLVAARGVRMAPGHSAPVYALKNLPDGRLSLSGSWDGTLKLWDLTNGMEVTTFRGHSSGVVALAISADGQRAISGSRDHTLKVWDLPGGRELLSLPGHAGAITAVSMTSDGLCAVSGADDGTLKVWDLENGVCLAEFRGENAIWACAIAHNGRTIVASESSGKMYFLEIMR